MFGYYTLVFYTVPFHYPSWVPTGAFVPHAHELKLDGWWHDYAECSADSFRRMYSRQCDGSRLPVPTHLSLMLLYAFYAKHVSTLQLKSLDGPTRAPPARQSTVAISISDTLRYLWSTFIRTKNKNFHAFISFGRFCNATSIAIMVETKNSISDCMIKRSEKRRAGNPEILKYKMVFPSLPICISSSCCYHIRTHSSMGNYHPYKSAAYTLFMWKVLAPNELFKRWIMIQTCHSGRANASINITNWKSHNRFRLIVEKYVRIWELIVWLMAHGWCATIRMVKTDTL